ncbi:MAG: formimidoylglutamase [Bacteroidota bacterium]|nr:formimidoylglutamase [Bacteroidota bacterium]
MSISDNFIPINVEKELSIIGSNDDSWLGNIDIYDKRFPDLKNRKIAIIGISDEESNTANNNIRNFLYSYTKKEYGKEVADLGNFIFDKKEKRIYQKLAYTLSEIIEQDVVPVLLGFSQEISFSQYLAFEYLKKIINVTCIDSLIDFKIDDKKEFDNQSYLYKILLKDPSYLFNISYLAFQTQLTDSEVIKLMEEHHFDLHRLGTIRDNINDIEPIIRTADLLSFDISAIRQSDAPGNNHPSPNGLFAEEACKILRYAGLSDNISSIGIFEYNPEFDNNNQTSRLIAQMIWYFVDGYLQRDNEINVKNNENFIKYITSDNNNSYQIIFYKSKKTNRWWMEIPGDKAKNYEDKQIIPCSYKDYIEATQGEIPERWLKALQKMD